MVFVLKAKICQWGRAAGVLLRKEVSFSDFSVLLMSQTLSRFLSHVPRI